MKIYNTMSRQKEDFTPQGGAVKMYVCGVTPYDEAHLGHAMSYIVFDVIRRYLLYRGYQVRHVQNVTDIDDKIILRANRSGVTTQELARKFSDSYFEDMQALNVMPADVYPRATEEIPKIIEIIQGLITKGHAYPAKGSVYFRVTSVADYGKLSHRTLDAMVAGARIEPAEEKEHPMDFALWKAARLEEPSWPSPWGAGRPGWHIECSAMSLKYLGEQLDIHGGGQDLIFPHHENEIAQSECYTGKQPFARYWVHNGFVNINKEKMSKSLGNLLTIKEILKDWHPEVLRLFFLSHHYRSPVDYSEDSLLEAKTGLDRFYTTLNAIKEKIGITPSTLTKEKPSSTPSPLMGEGKPARRTSSLAGGGGGVNLLEETQKIIDSFQTLFEEAMDDDFNTAQALGYFYDFQRNLNGLLDISKGRPNEEIASILKQGLNHFSKIGWVLGLFREDPEAYMDRQKKEGLKKRGLSQEEILKLIEERNTARKNKDWKKADEIRSDLLSRDIVLEDTPSKTLWKIK